MGVINPVQERFLHSQLALFVKQGKQMLVYGNENALFLPLDQSTSAGTPRGKVFGHFLPWTPGSAEAVEKDPTIHPVALKLITDMIAMIQAHEEQHRKDYAEVIAGATSYTFSIEIEACGGPNGATKL